MNYDNKTIVETNARMASLSPVETFPANIIAGMFGFRREILFDLGSEQQVSLDKVPEFKF